MRQKPLYTECTLYVDGFPELKVGDYIYTRGGSAYFVTSLRQSPSRPSRRNLKCLRWPRDEIPTDAKSYELFWYSRSKTAKQLRRSPDRR